MKTKKTTITMLCAAMALTLGLLFTSCKKAETGPKGETGTTGTQGVPGPSAKTFTFNCTFNSTTSFVSYSGITGFDTDDVLLFFVKYETLGTTSYWASMPLIIGNVNYIAEFSETSGLVFVNALKADGTTGSPFTSNVTLAFKAVLIKSAQRLANPTVNLNDYAAVKKSYNLID